MDTRLLLAKGLKRILNPPALRECHIHSTSRVCAKSELNRVEMEKYSYIGNDCFMVNVRIGSFCSIADRVCIGGASHPIERVSSSPVFHEGSNVMRKNFQQFPYHHTPKTIIENDVWIGIGSIIKAGITIHNGAVVGAGSVVTHDVPAYEVWAGNPAKLIRKRFDQEIKCELESLAWWDWPEDQIIKYSEFFEEPELLIEKCKQDGVI